MALEDLSATGQGGASANTSTDSFGKPSSSTSMATPAHTPPTATGDATSTTTIAVPNTAPNTAPTASAPNTAPTASAPNTAQIEATAALSISRPTEEKVVAATTTTTTATTTSNSAVPTSLTASKTLPSILTANSTSDSPGVAVASESQLSADSKTSRTEPDMSNSHGHHHILHHQNQGRYTSPDGSLQAPSGYPVTTLHSPTIFRPSPGTSAPREYKTYSPQLTHTQTPPPAHPQTSNGYRLSTATGNQLPLPSMRTIDSIAHQASHGMGLNHNGLGITTSVAPVSVGVPYYSPPSTLPTGYGMSADPLTRYTAMPHNPHSLLHRTPKKEIKRRTKTGCLTCRKRRIKCDEGHPTCNNCKKSKRECLGYDPIFRQQTIQATGNYPTHHPSSDAHNQPSTSPSISSSEPSRTLPPPSATISNSPVSTASSTTHTPTHASVPPEPRSNLYGNQYAPSSTYITSTISHGPLPPPVVKTPISTAPYSHTLAAKTESTNPPICHKAESAYASPAGGVPRALPSSAQLPDSTRPDSARSQYTTSQHHLRAKKMRINEIVDSLAPTPSVSSQPPSSDVIAETTRVYHEMYAGGLSAFFETSWYYFSDNGKMTFPQYPDLINLMGHFLKILEAVKANDHTQMAYSGALETRLVWRFAETARWAPGFASQTKHLPHDEDPAEARNRFQVVEALLCGDYLEVNPLCPPYQHPDTVRTRQFDFWYHLGEFVRRRDYPNAPETVKARDEVLSRMRHLLDGRENRDVLYSIAVVRELSPHFDPNYANSVPQHLDETDPKNRLAVASRFILDEAQVTGGTTNVVRRFSDIAARAFVNPGVNIARNP